MTLLEDVQCHKYYVDLHGIFSRRTRIWLALSTMIAFHDYFNSQNSTFSSFPLQVIVSEALAVTILTISATVRVTCYVLVHEDSKKSPDNSLTAT